MLCGIEGSIEPEPGRQAEQAHGSSTRIHNVGVVSARHDHRQTGDDHADPRIHLVLGDHC